MTTLIIQCAIGFIIGAIILFLYERSKILDQLSFLINRYNQIFGILMQFDITLQKAKNIKINKENNIFTANIDGQEIKARSYPEMVIKIIGEQQKNNFPLTKSF